MCTSFRSSTEADLNMRGAMRTEPEPSAAAPRTAPTPQRQTLDRRKISTPAHTCTRSREQGSTPIDSGIAKEQHTLKEAPRLQQSCRRQQLFLTLIVSCTLSNLALAATHREHYRNINTYNVTTQTPLPQDLIRSSTSSALPQDLLQSSTPSAAPEAETVAACSHSFNGCCSTERPPQQEWPTRPERQRHTLHNNNSTESDHRNITITAQGSSAASNSQRYYHTLNPTCYYRSTRLSSPNTHTTTTQSQHIQKRSYKPPHDSRTPHNANRELTIARHNHAARALQQPIDFAHRNPPLARCHCPKHLQSPHTHTTLTQSQPTQASSHNPPYKRTTTHAKNHQMLTPARRNHATRSPQQRTYHTHPKSTRAQTIAPQNYQYTAPDCSTNTTANTRTLPQHLHTHRRSKNTKTSQANTHTHTHPLANHRSKANQSTSQQIQTQQNTPLDTERANSPEQKPLPSRRRKQKLCLETPPNRTDRLHTITNTTHNISKLAHLTDCATKNTHSQRSHTTNNWPPTDTHFSQHTPLLNTPHTPPTITHLPLPSHNLTAICNLPNPSPSL